MKFKPSNIDFEELDVIIDKLNEKFKILLDSGHFTDIEEELVALMRKANKAETLNYGLTLTVFNSEKGHGIDVHEIGRTMGNDGEPYDYNGGDSLDRYISDGRIINIPHSACPNCWGVWDFKDLHSECRNCGFRLGKEVKYLIDDNVCPHCLDGRVSRENLKCDSCGYLINEDLVSWG